ncbi:MAG: UDP-N-acetylglucosamine 4,6-dehydratase (inverting) [Chloroflexi bacterium]|nr:UDP-N-acetylglucosamine 4,6-dehydratase (inverting) [Chloroflexota bacterium]
MAFSIKDKTILITGGTGSFGKKCVELLIKKGPPSKLIVFSRDELKQYEMQQQLSHPCLRFFIGDVRDRDRLYRAMRGVDIVIHAAALKQIPATEYNPFEAVKTNILGGVNVIDAALDTGVEQVIALSTDKAVSPVNLYGATKLCAEKLFVQGNSYSGADGTRFSCVRYGNVVGSRGSVIPLFLQQKSKGTITVTDERMTRFWITLEQGVEFVLRCLGIMNGGEIFVPKIPSTTITALATAIAPEAAIKFTGIRPGEKIHEILVSSDESRHTLELEDMFVIHPAGADLSQTELKGSRPLAEGFQYDSENNKEWLSIEEVQGIVAAL